MERFNDLGILFLRLGFGGTMLVHGLPKLMKLFGDAPITFADPIGLGMTASLVLTVLAEVGCAILIILGFKTRLASFPLVITMLVAVFVVHADHGFKKQELGLMYMFGYLALIFLGSGRYSIDSKLR